MSLTIKKSPCGGFFYCLKLVIDRAVVVVNGLIDLLRERDRVPSYELVKAYAVKVRENYAIFYARHFFVVFPITNTLLS